MSLELLVREAAALVRARAGWALLVATGAALWARTFPGAAEVPEIPSFLAGVVLALLVARGAVGRDFREGAALLWLQHPVRPWVRYGARAGLLAGLVLGCHGLLGALLAAAGLVAGPASPGAVVGLVLTDLAVLAVAFGVAALAPPVESLVSALLVLALATAGPDAALDPEAFGVGGPWLAAIRLPVLEIRAVSSWVDGAAGRPDAAALLRPLLHPAGWTAMALVVVEHRARGGCRLRRADPPATPTPDPPPPPPPGGAPPR